MGLKASKPIWQRSMQRHHYASNVRQPRLTTRVDHEEAARATERLAKNDCTDGYGARTTPAVRNEYERVILY